MPFMTRRYESAVRDARASRTREALLEACRELMLEEPIEAVTIPAVATRAGVTKPTAYSHFPDNDALVAGFLQHMRDRVGMEHETLAAIRPEGMPDAVRQNYRRYEQNAKVMLRILESPSYNRVRLARKVDRPGMVLRQWAGAAPEKTLREQLGPLYMLVTPVAWRWLTETWGLSGEEAARAAAWAMKTLVAALEPSTTHSTPATKKSTKTAASSGRKKKTSTP
jgi:AcrR family transcriptional regulator